jgi:hypothetical protein
MVSTMRTSRSYQFCSPIHCDYRSTSSKLRMTHHRSLTLVLAVLMTLSMILQPTSAFSLSNNKNKCSFRSARIGQKSTIPNSLMPHSLNILLASSSSDSIDTSSSSAPDNENDGTFRDNIRKLTGVSLTALRATMRAATGISSTAIYASALAASGVWIRTVMKTILAPIPASVRFFLQFFLVLYYAPLYIVRNLTGPTRKNAHKKREEFLEGWNDAVKAAEEKSTSWPLDPNKDGFIDAEIEKVDVNGE